MALDDNTTGVQNTAVGGYSLHSNIGGYSNVAVGYNALRLNNTGFQNVGLGERALYANTTGYNNVAIGFQSLDINDIGYNNIGIGTDALGANTTGEKNTGVGTCALTALTTSVNCTGLGANSVITGDNQVQLGDSATRVYGYGAYVDRNCDERDKTDIRDTTLGLSFICALRPIDFKWDYREDYKPAMPLLATDATEEEKATYEVAKSKWIEDSKLVNLVHDGTHKRIRYHHGFTAQDVKKVMDAYETDFGGYQDHKINGGDDSLCLGYSEFIGPLVKAIQELSADFSAYKLTHP